MNKKEKIEFRIDNLKDHSDGFVVPSAYFDDMEDRIMSKISMDKASKNEKITHWNNWLFIGASVAALLLLSVFVFTPEKYIKFDGLLQQEVSVVEWDQYAVFEESWIVEELEQNLSLPDDLVYQEDIDFLMDEDITNDEIIAAINE